MRERPILFSGPMVRAILEGRKTQTRRVIKPQPDWIRPAVGDDGVAHGYCGSGPADGIACPYGKPGDRLWVREAFKADGEFAKYGTGRVRYLADIEPPAYERRWKPSIHMPRWASRITLEVVAVRVERLQEISEADAVAEGSPKSHPSIDHVSMNFGFPDFSRSYFAQLWESINGHDSWAANPWVWVVEFKRINPS